jgi:DTW domain-containing protein YfiP
MILPEARPECARCGRPTKVCLCAHLRPIATRTRLLIVQHPREHREARGTARLVASCVTGSALVVTTRPDDHPVVRAWLDAPDARPALLYPGPDAATLSAAAAPRTLVVVDGTWPQSRKLLRCNPRLAALPKATLPAGATSTYRIRRQPRPECLSTLEAVAAALGAMEAGDAFTGLYAPFEAMIEQWLAHLPPTA